MHCPTSVRNTKPLGKWWQVGAPRPLEDDQLLEDNIEYEFVPLTTAEFGFMVNRLDRSLQREKAITNIIGRLFMCLKTTQLTINKTLICFTGSFAVAGWVLGAVAIGLQNEYFFAAGAVGSLSGVLAVVWLALRKFRERRHAQAFFDLICAGLGIH